jgi:predicted RNase H-like nuclease (RuvC/YqgF family)
MVHKRMVLVGVIAVLGLVLGVQRAVAVMTEQAISHESIAKALSDVKSLQHDRQRHDQEREVGIPAHATLDLSKVNSSNEKTIFDTVQFEETLTMVQQQETLFAMQIKQLTDRYQKLKQESLQQTAADKKKIEELNRRVAQLEKELMESKQQLHTAQVAAEAVKNTTQVVSAVASGDGMLLRP